jgi:hypothetical protein
MTLLELFAGTRSVGRVAETMGWEVYSSDIMPEFGTDYTTDILDFDVARVPWTPDVVWASPPCTTFSVASISTHWTPDHRPKTTAAVHGVAIVERTLGIIRHFQNLNDRLLYYIENPVGKLRKLPIVADQPRRVTVTYCQYGDSRMKPTDIFTNDLLWVPRPMCNQGDPCHESAPRGSKTGTQGLKDATERSRIPTALCLEILQSGAMR